MRRRERTVCRSLTLRNLRHGCIDGERGVTSGWVLFKKLDCSRLVPINVRSLSELPDDRTVAIRRIWRWAVSIGSFEGSRWRSRRMRAVLWDFNRFMPGKPCQKQVLPKRQSLILIDLWQTLSAKQLVSVFVDLMLGECVSSKTTGRCSRRCFPANGSKWRGISGAVERLRGFPSPDVLLHTLIPHAGRG